MNGVAAITDPLAVVTTTFCAPDPAGVVAVMVVSVLVNTVALTLPTVTVALAKLLPVIVIVVPPAAGPLDGLTLATVGASTYVNFVAAVTGPPAVVTTTFCAPDPAGVVAVITVALLVNTVALALPTVTVALTKLVPVIVIVVPPIAGPLDGLTLATVGAAI